MSNGRQVAAVVLLVVGVFFIGLGSTWKFWYSPKTLWTRNDATEYTDAYRAMKFAAMSGRKPAEPNDPKFAAAKARYDASKAKLDRAIAISDYAGTVLLAVGLVVTSVGAWLFSTRERSGNLASGR
jgi:hypothetical protein